VLSDLKVVGANADASGEKATDDARKKEDTFMFSQSVSQSVSQSASQSIRLSHEAKVTNNPTFSQSLKTMIVRIRRST